METAVRILVYGVLAYGALVVAVTLYQRSLLYFPGGDVPSPDQAGVPEMQPVTIRTGDGLDLLAWYRPAAGGSEALPTIVYFHGNGGNLAMRSFAVRPFLDAGLGVLLVSYRGYGGNPVCPTEQGLYRDGHAALNFLKSLGVPPELTVLYGESLGTGVAVAMAAGRQVGAVILEAPFTSAVDVAAAHYWFLPVRLLQWDRFDSLSRIGAIGAPLLVLYGTVDDIVPATKASCSRPPIP